MTDTKIIHGAQRYRAKTKKKNDYSQKPLSDDSELLWQYCVHVLSYADTASGRRYELKELDFLRGISFLESFNCFPSTDKGVALSRKSLELLERTEILLVTPGLRNGGVALIGGEGAAELG